jgi:hypothetical protein
MRANGSGRGIVHQDSREDLKRRIFQELDELATSNEVAVIYELYELVRQEDPSLSEQSRAQPKER